ncbi:MAG: AraC family transcriptional regulator, partial [Myxococcota bacterium]
TEVRYGQTWAGFTLSPGILDVPLKMADPEAFRVAELLCQHALEALGAEGSHAAKVRRLLLERRNGFPSLTTTARLLHMTPRTLHRRLLAEGTSYREILEDLRYRLAIDHLKSGRSNIDEIAYILGYSDPANFRRAFKRWAQVPPSVFRARMLTGAHPVIGIDLDFP